MRTVSFSTIVLSSLLLGLAACSSSGEKDVPRYGSITQRLTMIDAEGRNYGVVELDPINGGKLYDAQTRLIGRIIPVPQEQLPVPAPVAVAPVGYPPQPYAVQPAPVR